MFGVRIYVRRNACLTLQSIIAFVTLVTLLALSAASCVHVPRSCEGCDVVMSKIRRNIDLVLRTLCGQGLGLDKVYGTFVCLQRKRNAHSAYGALVVLHLCDLDYAALQRPLSHYACIGVAYEPVLCRLVDMRSYAVRTVGPVFTVSSCRPLKSLWTLCTVRALRSVLSGRPLLSLRPLGACLASGQTERERKHFGRVLS